MWSHRFAKQCPQQLIDVIRGSTHRPVATFVYKAAGAQRRAFMSPAQSAGRTCQLLGLKPQRLGAGSLSEADLLC